MRAYIVYSNYNGSSEGAALVFANNIKEAKKLAYDAIWDWIDGYTDLAIRWVRHECYFVLGNQEKLKNNISHVIDNPEHCVACGTWGNELTIDKLCGFCNEFPGEKLIKLYEDYENSNCKNTR